MKKAKLSGQSREMLGRFKEEARQRILKQEFVQFRVDAPMMDLLLKVGDRKRQPVGVMVREWVTDRLGREARTLPLPKVKLPDGRVLNEKSALSDIEKAVLDYQSGRIKLSQKSYRTLMDWLLDKHLAAKYAC